MSRRTLYLSLVLSALTALLLTGCGKNQTSGRVDYEMGERAIVGPLTYNVIESTWKSQLGNEFSLRPPQQRFLLIMISVTNGGGREVSVPLLTLENDNGQSFVESDNGQGVDNWFGILRNIAPAQTQQGRLLFDVPLGSYKLRLSDGGGAGTEKYAWVKLPLHIDTDSSVEAPVPTAK